MNQGVIQQVGTPREIYQSPENLFVANFVGQTNLLKGVVNRHNHTIETPFGALPTHRIHHDQGEREVYVSLRPEGLYLDPEGSIEGIIVDYTYLGSSIDAVIKVKGIEQTLLAHIHTDKTFHIGDVVRFGVMSGYVSAFV